MTTSDRPPVRSSGPAAPGAMTARQWRIDAAIALGVTALQVGAGYAITWAHPKPVTAAPFAYLLVVISGLVLLGRRRFPVAVLAVSLAASLGASALGVRAAYLALIVAFFNAVLARRRVAAIASLVIGYLGTVLPGLVGLGGGHPSLAFDVALAAWFLVLLSAAELIRARRQRAAQLEQAREDESRRRAMQERLAIARDLHDVVAHNISVINVQANTALYLMDRQPERARAALTAIHEVSRQALTELRSVLGVLRADGEAPPRAPGPGLDQIADLVARSRSAGLPVSVSEQGEPRSIPAEVGVAAYRIVQEALTNTARHAAGGSATVRIGYGDAALTVEVNDDGPTQRDQAQRDQAPRDQAEPASGTGNGIIGMTERAQALGGSLQAGPGPAGGFRVLATLPLPPEAVRMAPAANGGAP
jgi:signal transduction histidine kinase